MCFMYVYIYLIIFVWRLCAFRLFGVNTMAENGMEQALKCQPFGHGMICSTFQSYIRQSRI